MFLYIQVRIIFVVVSDIYLIIVFIFIKSKQLKIMIKVHCPLSKKTKIFCHGTKIVFKNVKIRYWCIIQSYIIHAHMLYSFICRKGFGNYYLYLSLGSSDTVTVLSHSARVEQLTVIKSNENVGFWVKGKRCWQERGTKGTKDGC